LMWLIYISMVRDLKEKIKLAPNSIDSQQLLFNYNRFH
jgi:hypothetical protein